MNGIKNKLFLYLIVSTMLYDFIPSFLFFRHMKSSFPILIFISYMQRDSRKGLQ